MEFPFRVQFVGEKAIDIGGVSRDMLSAYWEEVYKRFFDGLTLVTPAVHPHMDLSVLPTVGKILSHGYLVSGFLPVRIAFPTLACILLGPNCEVPPQILIDAFADSLCTFEVRIIKDALQQASLAGVSSFSDEMKTALINLLSRYGCREIPTSQSLKRQLFEVAKYEFQLKPLGAISAMNSGITLCERTFWQQQKVEGLHLLYTSLSATPGKILSWIEEPEDLNPCEQKVFGYLQQYIGNMKVEELQKFLRFTTGSSVLIGKHVCCL